MVEGHNIIPGGFSDVQRSADASSTYEVIDGAHVYKDSKNAASSAHKVTSTPGHYSSSIEKNMSSATATFTTKTFDNQANSMVVTDESKINEKDFKMRDSNQQLTSDRSTNNTVGSNTNNTSQQLTSDRTSKNTVSSSTDKKATSSKTTTSTASEEVQFYDKSTKEWTQIDEKQLRQISKPSYVRYVSTNTDGSMTTTYKKKVFDNRTKSWKLVEEKVVKGDVTKEPVPLIDDIPNMTRTTYTTKMYDTKTGLWRVIEENSYLDAETRLPTDVIDEIQKDHPDLANVVTTTEVTQVYILNHYVIPFVFSNNCFNGIIMGIVVVVVFVFVVLKP
jgi:hypothetical protein